MIPPERSTERRRYIFGVCEEGSVSMKREFGYRFIYEQKKRVLTLLNSLPSRSSSLYNIAASINHMNS